MRSGRWIVTYHIETLHADRIDQLIASLHADEMQAKTEQSEQEPNG